MGRPGDPLIFWVGYPTQPNLLGWVPKAETPRVTRGLPRPMPNTESEEEVDSDTNAENDENTSEEQRREEEVAVIGGKQRMLKERWW